jgi:excinuclease ABC subunit C
MIPITEEFRNRIRSIPEDPGVYRFFNKRGKIIYIGKAKRLRRRVTSYFTGLGKHSRRIYELVSRIHDLQYTVTNNEVEALILENNLIKSHQPRYNIMLKDGKTYPFIGIRKERFPRIFVTRKKEADGSDYFGPYTSVGAMNVILDLIRGYIPLRNCNYNLSPDNIASGKFRLCMEYHVRNCAGPCTGKQSEEDYMEGINQVRHILKGNLQIVISDLDQKMKLAAEKYQFEEAEFFRRRLEDVKLYKRKNTIVSPRLGDLEVLTVAVEAHLAVVNHFKVENGAIIQTHSWEIKRQNEEEAPEILAAAFDHLLSTVDTVFPEIIVNHHPVEDEVTEGFKFTVPQRGDKYRLLELSLKNCFTLLKEKLYDQSFRKKDPGKVAVEELQAALHLKNVPDHIECFDNSNFQGSFPVASLVVFREGKPSKKDYRHFNIKTVEGPNDFASMEEVVGRRYSRLIAEKSPFPDLIIVDGGKGQLSSAASALQSLDLLDKIPVIGIAKRLEEIYVLNDPFPLYIDKKSPALKLIQQMRNEAHRFAISFHRDKRSKELTKGSKLQNIKGIGPGSAGRILKAFRSIKKLKEASPEERESVLGKALSRLVENAIQEGEL